MIKSRKKLIREVFETIEVTLLQCIAYIWDLVKFQESSEISVMIDFGSKINAKTPTHAVNLILPILKTNLGTQKIDGMTLVTDSEVINRILMQDKLGKFSFFKKTFIVVDISIEMNLEMSLFSVHDIKIWFAETSNLT